MCNYEVLCLKSKNGITLHVARHERILYASFITLYLSESQFSFQSYDVSVLTPSLCEMAADR